MSISPISFGYQHPLKTMWKSGRFPTVKVGIYGDELTRENITLEHLVPVCRGGKTELANLALASQERNHERNAFNIFLFATEEQIREYLKQFENIVVFNFNGHKYIQDLQNTLEKIKRGQL